MNIACIIPTCEAGFGWPVFINRLKRQMVVHSDRVFIVDSSSQDNTAILASEAGFNVYVIPREEFDHGGTRQFAVELLPEETDIVVFLTQDALLVSDDAIQKLVSVFDDPKVGCAYGRQLPHLDASPIGIHARLFNYPSDSYLRDFSDRNVFGIKTAFLSNSFAAYRVSALEHVGGFPRRVILAEDMIVAAKLLQKNYLVAYVANACVYHSHNYTPWQEFKRYFDIGVLHHREAWLLLELGSPKEEGRRFLISELCYLTRHAPWLLPLSLVNIFMKWLGYSLGRCEMQTPNFIKKKLSMRENFWAKDNG